MKVVSILSLLSEWQGPECLKDASTSACADYLANPELTSNAE